MAWKGDRKYIFLENRSDCITSTVSPVFSGSLIKWTSYMHIKQTPLNSSSPKPGSNLSLSRLSTVRESSIVHFMYIACLNYAQLG